MRDYLNKDDYKLTHYTYQICLYNISKLTLETRHFIRFFYIEDQVRIIPYDQATKVKITRMFLI